MLPPTLPSGCEGSKDLDLDCPDKPGNDGKKGQTGFRDDAHVTAAERAARSPSQSSIAWEASVAKSANLAVPAKGDDHAGDRTTLHMARHRTPHAGEPRFGQSAGAHGRRHAGR
jgi:hypothetical protein